MAPGCRRTGRWTTISNRVRHFLVRRHQMPLHGAVDALTFLTLASTIHDFLAKIAKFKQNNGFASN